MYETVNLPSGLISCDLLNTEFLLQFLRQRIFVYHHTDCFSTYIAFRHIQITSGFVAFRSPGILGDIIFSTILIFHNTGDVHQVVVSCHKLLVTILTDFRCYVDFRIRMFKPVSATGKQTTVRRAMTATRTCCFFLCRDWQ